MFLCMSNNNRMSNNVITFILITVGFIYFMIGTKKKINKTRYEEWYVDVVVEVVKSGRNSSRRSGQNRNRVEGKAQRSW